MVLSIFSCVCWPSVCLLWRNVYLDLSPPVFDCVVFFILSCMSCLDILESNSFLEINSLLVAPFANVFSHCEGCLFVLFMVSFALYRSILDNMSSRKSLKVSWSPELLLFLSFQMMDAIKGTMTEIYNDLSKNTTGSTIAEVRGDTCHSCFFVVVICASYIFLKFLKTGVKLLCSVV